MTQTPLTRSEISVVVPSFRRAKWLRDCLIALINQTLQPLEIIVVLRADDEESRAAIAKTNKPIRILTVDQPGQVAALNRGCEAAIGRFIAITDDDAIPRSDWLQAIAARFATDTRIGAVGGRDVVHRAGRIEDASADRVGRALWWGRVVGNHHLRSHLQDVDHLRGANMAFRASAREPFDSCLLGEGAQVCNDLEATWSVRRRGWRVVYDPAIVVDHYPGPRYDGDGRDRRSRQAVRDEAHNRVYALLRHSSRWHRPILLMYQLLVGTRRYPGLLLAVHPAISTARRAQVPRLTAARLAALRSLRLSARSRSLTVSNTEK